MATRRVITSAIWEDDWFGQLSFFEQALWIGLFSQCADDQGRLLDNPILIRAAVFPYKDIPIDDVEQALADFVRAERIYRYESSRDKGLIQILKWWTHQPQQWASASRWEAPRGWQDHIRTRENNQYVVENWEGKGENAQANADWRPPSEPMADCSGECSPEYLTYTTQAGGHVPVPVPDPVPDPDTDAPTGGAGAPTQPPGGEGGGNGNGASAEKHEQRPYPRNFDGWMQELRDAKNDNYRVGVVMRMYNALYADQNVEPPTFGRIRGAIKAIGTCSRTAQLLWEHSARPPVGDVLSYVTKVAKGQEARASPRKTRIDRTTDAIHAYREKRKAESGQL